MSGDKKNGFSHLRPQKVIDKSAFGSASFAAEAIYSAVCLISTGLSIFALVQAVIQGAEHSAQFFTKIFAPFKLSKRSERINLSGCAPHGQAFVQGASRHKRQRALSSIAVFFTNGISISPFPCYIKYRGVFSPLPVKKMDFGCNQAHPCPSRGRGNSGAAAHNPLGATPQTPFSI